MNKTERFWDRLSKNFDKRVKRYDHVYLRTIDKTKGYLQDNDVVLDYGCGTGIITNEIAGRVKTIHAIDLSSKMIKAADKKAQDRNIVNIHYVPATIFDERYRRESFDVILVFNILHLLEDTPGVMRRIHELLKPGGVIVSSTACLGQKKSLLGMLIFIVSALRIVPYVKLFTHIELEALVTSQGLQIVETEDLGDSYFIAAKKT